MNLASLSYADGNYTGITIYTPVAGRQNPRSDGPPQEYLGIAPTPEPGSLLLMGSGLSCVWAFRRRFFA